MLCFSVAWAIEYKPYPAAQITESQWVGYYEQVKATHGATMQNFREQRLVVFHDNASTTSYAFTQAGHPAHPAWITRKIVQHGQDVFVEQIGYFAGAEPPFAELYRQYQALNQRIIEDLKKRRTK